MMCDVGSKAAQISVQRQWQYPDFYSWRFSKRFHLKSMPATQTNIASLPASSQGGERPREDSCRPQCGPCSYQKALSLAKQISLEEISRLKLRALLVTWVPFLSTISWLSPVWIPQPLVFKPKTAYCLQSVYDPFPVLLAGGLNKKKFTPEWSFYIFLFVQQSPYDSISSTNSSFILVTEGSKPIIARVLLPVNFLSLLALKQAVVSFQRPCLLVKQEHKRKMGQIWKGSKWNQSLKQG